MTEATLTKREPPDAEGGVATGNGKSASGGKDPVSTFADAIDKICASIDKHGASAWLAGFGATMIAVAMTAQTLPGVSDLTPGEFVAVLICGLLFVMMGAGFRLYRGYLSEKALQADFAYLLAQDAEANVGRRSDLDKHREHQRTGAEQA